MWNAPETLASRYVAFVKKCLTDRNTFDQFKTSIDYISIVGTPQTFQLHHFLDKIQKHSDVIAKLDEFLVNDAQGNPPFIVEFNGKNVSMGTIRYIHSLCDIKSHFGSLDNMIISEMGVGYGGLAFALKKFYNIKTYHLIDIPEVQQLAIKYLSLLNIPATSDPPPENVDLFISEFCLSEFDDEDIYKFYNKYVKNANNVYLQMNLIDEVRKQKFISYMNKDFSMEIIPEDHGTGFPAYVIIGKKDTHYAKNMVMDNAVTLTY